MIESSTPAMKGEKTKYRLAAAMKECMKTTPVDAITVRQITEHCGVTRQTFYRNFLDKYDLINWYFDKLLARSFEHMGRGTTVLDSLEKKFTYIQEEKAFFAAAFRYDRQNSLREHDFKLILAFYENLIREKLEEMCQDSPMNEKLEISIGKIIASWKDPEDMDTYLDRADEAMYQEKKQYYERNHIERRRQGDRN